VRVKVRADYGGRLSTLEVFFHPRRIIAVENVRDGVIYFNGDAEGRVEGRAQEEGGADKAAVLVQDTDTHGLAITFHYNLRGDDFRQQNMEYVREYHFYIFAKSARSSEANH